MDAAKKDMILHQIECEIKNNKKKMMKRLYEVERVKQHNQFLDKVHVDYQKYKEHIVKQEENKQREMKLILDYLEKTRKEAGLSEEMVKRTKFQQQKIVKRMNNVRDELANLVDKNK